MTVKYDVAVIGAVAAEQQGIVAALDSAFRLAYLNREGRDTVHETRQFIGASEHETYLAVSVRVTARRDRSLLLSTCTERNCFRYRRTPGLKPAARLA